MMGRTLMIAALALALGGCAAYSWKSTVPADMRTVTVSVFRNTSKITAMGTVCAAELGRELQREGTFRLSDEGALELQGEVVSSTGGTRYNERAYGQRYRNGELKVAVRVSLIDKRRGAVLWDARQFEAATGVVYGGRDTVTAERDASGRIAEDLARQIVDALAACDFREKSEDSGNKETK